MLWTYRLDHWKKHHNLNPKNILDVGACVGHFYDLAKSIWPETKITMVEANAYCDQILKTKNSEYYICTLSDKIKHAIFYTNDQNISTGESLYREKTEFYDNNKIKMHHIETTTLDTLFPNRVFEFIKLDTQGSEIDILKGGINLIANTEYILLEAPIVEYNLGAPSLQKILYELEQMNFKIVDIWNCAYANRVAGCHFDDLCQIDIFFQRK